MYILAYTSTCMTTSYKKKQCFICIYMCVYINVLQKYKDSTSQSIFENNLCIYNHARLYRNNYNQMFNS